MDPSEKCETNDRVSLSPCFTVAAGGEKMLTVSFPQTGYTYMHVYAHVYVEFTADLILILPCLVMKCTKSS